VGYFVKMKNVRHVRSQAGQALVELAFVLPILVLLILGVIEIGRYAYISILVGNAARSGAAYGAQNLSTNGDTTGINNAANNDFLSNGMSGLTTTSFNTCGCDVNGTVSSDTQGNCTPGAPPACAGGHWVITLHVTSTGQFNGLFNFLGATAPTITQTAIMRVQPI
jgi:Flp pilus assembly protein TadG